MQFFKVYRFTFDYQKSITFHVCVLLAIIFIRIAIQALTNVYGSNENNERGSNVTVVITNTISALSSASANNTNTDSDTISSTLTGRSFYQSTYSIFLNVIEILYDSIFH